MSRSAGTSIRLAEVLSALSLTTDLGSGMPFEMGLRTCGDASAAPNCRWESWASNRAQLAGLPTMQPQTGPAGVAEFFHAVGQLQFREFQVLDLLGGERQVAVEVMIDFDSPSGGRLRDEELHLWTLDEQQRVVRMRHYVDTAKHIAAFAGEDTAAQSST